MPDHANVDEVRARFAATADRVGEHAERQVALVREQLESFVVPRGDERALDVGTGAGTLALALAPLVREVVGVDVVPELLARARERAQDVPNVTFAEGDLTRLEFERASFDLAATLRTLHHVPRPELAVAELARVTRPGRCRSRSARPRRSGGRSPWSRPAAAASRARASSATRAPARAGRRSDPC